MFCTTSVAECRMLKKEGSKTRDCSTYSEFIMMRETDTLVSLFFLQIYSSVLVDINKYNN